MIMQQRAKLIFPLALVFYEIAFYLSNDMYLPALPVMMRELSLTSQQAQLTLTMWFLGAASLPIFIGPLADRFGRRIVLLIGGIIYIATTLICALTNNISVLLIARFLEGSMMATMLVPGYACVHELFEQKQAIRILALMSSISILAPALGPLMGGTLLLFASWRVIFWFIAAWALLAMLFLYKWMPETRLEKVQNLDFLSILKQYGRVLANKHFMLNMFVLGLIMSGWIVWISAGPLLVIDTFHFSEVAFGVIQAMVFAAYIIGNYCVKYLMERITVSLLIKTGLVLTLIGGMLVLMTAIQFPISFYPFLFAMLIYSFGSALCFSPLNRITIEASTEPMGVRVSLFAVFLTAFSVLGSAAAAEFFNGSLLSIGLLIAGAICVSCLLKIMTAFVGVPVTADNKIQ